MTLDSAAAALASTDEAKLCSEQATGNMPAPSSTVEYSSSQGDGGTGAGGSQTLSLAFFLQD